MSGVAIFSTNVRTVGAGSDLVCHINWKNPSNFFVFQKISLTFARVKAYVFACLNDRQPHA